MLSLFSPKWKKQSKLVLKGSEKYVNYRRDLLEEEKLAEIDAERQGLKAAVKASDKEKAQAHSENLNKLCNFSAGMSNADASIAENTEVIFVAIAIALGLRAYVVQPFRIPTGSMQPTLNGIRGEDVAVDEWPGFVGRGKEFLVNGRSYKNFTLEEDDAFLGLRESTVLFFTFTKLEFEKAGTVTFSGSASSFINGLGMGDALQESIRDAYQEALAQNNSAEKDRLERLLPIPTETGNLSYNAPAYDVTKGNAGFRIPVAAGTTLFEGYVQTGDLILVDKISYHFRQPERGEVFVFDTRNIEGTFGGNADKMIKMGRQAGGEHYIKRLAGTPGDTLEIRPSAKDGVDGELFVNGELATGVGFDKVHSGEGEYNGYFPNGRLAPGGTATLKAGKDPAFNEYLPLGDNSRNSLDGRYWEVPKGSDRWEAVHGYNLVGPAWFSLWPVTDHWGFIK